MAITKEISMDANMAALARVVLNTAVYSGSPQGNAQLMLHSDKSDPL